MTSVLPTLDRPDDDPHLWLEDIDGSRATEWADAQSARTLARYGGPGVLADRDKLAAILDRPDNIPFVGRRGGRRFNFW
jgi:prolyl oligopeptidase